MTRRRRRPRQSGFTLIELLVVVTILGLISGIVGVAVNNAMESARRNTAEVQINNLSNALDLYKLKFFRYPSTAEGLPALESPPKGAPLVESLPDDPWGSPYIYSSPGTEKRKGYDLYSKGGDLQDQTEDDIR